MTGDEYHVASYVVRTLPADAAHVVRHISSMSGLEVHAEEQGKLVVTAEARSARDLATIADDLGAVASVVSVAPVYHEYSDAGEPAADAPRKQQ